MSDENEYAERGEPLDAKTQELVRHQVGLYGVYVAARQIGISRAAVTSAGCGAPLYKSTRTAIYRFFSNGVRR